ncbi:hypothetical protein HK099_003415 [Clydaea vesicula]|uniref:Secreted protein n=1 Tax=Clydaea vesicula TaxID=447962 RepID=A0AAD5U225_9FUNG|nr:hypothetical protein HK099_003415 [Clydaea vesicula]KAJ3391540.1 hypothetical protein HDU92_008989 [Lobulomyces angularis]
MKFAVVASLLSALTVAADVPVSGDAPPPGSVTIGKVIYGGSGCPQGTVSQNFNSDNTAFTLLFDSYYASIGQGVPITEARKNCQFNAELKVPQGWQFSLLTIDYRGFLALDSGVTAQQSSNYYFQGSINQARKTSTFTEVNNGDYTIRDTFGLVSTVWSDCNASANLNVNSQVRLSGPSGKNGLITADSTDFKVTHKYGIQWKKC